MKLFDTIKKTARKAGEKVLAEYQEFLEDDGPVGRGIDAADKFLRKAPVAQDLATVGDAATYAAKPSRVANLILSKSDDPIYKDYAYQQLLQDEESPVSARETLGASIGIGSLAAPVLKVPGAIAGARPVIRLAGSGIIRGLETAAPQYARDYIQDGIETANDNFGNNFMFGAGANTLLSPRLIKDASEDFFIKGFERKPGYLRIPNFEGDYAKEVRNGVEQVIGGDTINKIKRVTRTKAWKSGQIDEANFPVEGIDVLADDLRGAIPQWQNLSTGEIIDEIVKLPTKSKAKVPKSSTVSTGKTPEYVPDYQASMKEKLIRLGTSGDAELRKQGQSGAALADTMQEQRMNARMLAGSLKQRMIDASQGYDPRFNDEVRSFLEGGAAPADPQAFRFAREIRNLLDEAANRVSASGITMKMPNGSEVPFRPRENYFPRYYDFESLGTPEGRERAIRHLLETGQAASQAQAEKMLDMMKSTVRRVGNLERPRLADLPDYEKDVTKALTTYIDDFSRRVTQAELFGPKNELATEIMEAIRQEGGDASYAQEVFDLFTRVKGDDLRYASKWVDGVLKYNTITKLDLAALSNVNQSANTGSVAGITHLFNGLLETATNWKQAESFARKAGVLDDRVTTRSNVGIESAGRIFDLVMTPFQKVENFNRVVAANSAKQYAKGLTEVLQSNPEAKSAIRQLERLGLDPEAIMRRGLTEDDILKGSYKFTANTQFQTDVLDVPPGWKTNVGRILTQFKSFSFKQTIFLRDQVISEATRGNFQPLARLLILGMPLSYAAWNARNVLTGRDPSDEQKNLDVRAGDALFKAVGGMPIDLATQAHYLATNVFDKDYINPVEKAARVAGFLGGPTVGTVAGVFGDLAQTGDILDENAEIAEGKKKGKLPTDPLLPQKRRLAGDVPLVGEYTKNAFFSYPKDNKSNFARLIDALEAGDTAEMDRVLETYDPKSRKAAVKRAQEILESEGKPVSELPYASSNAFAGSARASEIPTTQGLAQEILVNGKTSQQLDKDKRATRAKGMKERNGLKDGYADFKKAMNSKKFSEQEKEELKLAYPEQFAKRYELDKTGSTDASMYTQVAKAARRDGDTDLWLDATREEITRLEEYIQTIPEDEELTRIKFENKLADLKEDADRIESTGSFTARKSTKKSSGSTTRKSSGSTAKAKVPEISVATQVKTTKVTVPKAAIPKLNAPRAKKLSVRKVKVKSLNKR